MATDPRLEELLSRVENVGERYQTRMADGRPVPNVANVGASIGSELTITRKGMYHGLSVISLVEIAPLWTSHRVATLCRKLIANDWMNALRDLQKAGVKVSSVDDVREWIEGWLERLNGSQEPFISWTLPGPLQISSVGTRQGGGTVVPPEWSGRTFPDAEAIHRAIDQLEWRKGKGPTTYALTYGTIVSPPVSWTSRAQKSKVYLIQVGEEGVSARLSPPEEGYRYRLYQGHEYGVTDALWGRPETVKAEPCGVLVSRLQKAIRRGPGASKILRETVRSLAVAPSYVLPDHGYQKVSGGRGLVWRLAISSIEDSTPPGGDGLADLLTLVCLSVVAHLEPDRFWSEGVVSCLSRTALAVQAWGEAPSWRLNAPPLPPAAKRESRLQQACRVAIDSLPMMQGDRKMLAWFYHNNPEPPQLSVPSRPNRTSNQVIEEDVRLSSYDMHCHPAIILHWGATLPLGLTLPQIASRIWEESSKQNYRIPGHREEAPASLREIQRVIADGLLVPSKRTELVCPSERVVMDNMQPSTQTMLAETAFACVFGGVYYYQRQKVVLVARMGSGTPAQIRKMEKGEDGEMTAEWVDAPGLEEYFPRRTVTLGDPPAGYHWIRPVVQAKVVDGRPVVDGKVLPWGDGSSLLRRWKLTPSDLSKKTARRVSRVLRGKGMTVEEMMEYRDTCRTKVYRLPEGVHRELIWHVLTLLQTASDRVQIGPVSRSGEGTERALHPTCEAAGLGVLLVLHWLYPDTLVPVTGTRFQVNHDSPTYGFMLSELRRVGAPERGFSLVAEEPQNLTPLMPHQRDSIKKIEAGMDAGYHSWGDASRTGSGKTYAALVAALMAVQRCKDSQWSGVLVALPKPDLIKTWKAEIEKHTTGWHTVYHKAGTEIGHIHQNTLVVSTLARIRDNPTRHPWAMYIVDECLSVKNDGAKWTQEAWRQALASRYVLLLSATFMRSKVGELYYMLGMLQTGLPVQKDYLDAILISRINRRIPESPATWTEYTHRIQLKPADRVIYQQARETAGGDKKVWGACVRALRNTNIRRTLIKALRRLIRSLEEEGRRILFFADSKAEVEELSTALGIEPYPAKGRHTIISVSRGAHGLNDLVCYDTILCRPPPPDLLPQMQGRLDRPGQKNTDLQLHYFLLADTIEEGLVLRMAAAAQFGREYMMPLTVFYRISLQGELDEGLQD